MKKVFQISDFIYRLFISDFSLLQKYTILFVYIRLFLQKICFIKKDYVKIFWFNIKWRSLSHLIWLFWEIFLKNEYFFKSDSKNPLIIDWWSNIWMNVFYRKLLYPNAIVYCFEPDIINFKLLKRNVDHNKIENVFIYNKAIGEVNWTIDFFYEEDKLTTSSVFGKRWWNKSIKIPLIKLSDIIKNENINNIDLLKLDIEWSEDQCIRDLYMNTKFQCIKKMIIEYHNNISGKKDSLWIFLNMLEKMNFNCYLEAEIYQNINKEMNQDFMIYTIHND